MFFREARTLPGYRWFDLLHGYIYARWPYLYIAIGTGEHPLAKRLSPHVRRLMALLNANKRQNNSNAPGITFADTYHGKAIPLDKAIELVSVKEDISLPNLEHVIPYQMAKDLILKQPDHIVVMECPCRVARTKPCLPLDVCLIIGEPFASFVLEHQPRRARKLRPEEAIAILKAEDQRGHVHHAFFKDAMLGRFYAICNCCSCCCGAIQAHRSGTPMLASSGYVCEVNPSECIACGLCLEVCQFQALSMNDALEVNTDECMGCGICVAHCPNDALELVRALDKPSPLSLN